MRRWCPRRQIGWMQLICIVALIGVGGEVASGQVESGLEQLFADHPAEREWIAAIDSAMAGDKRLDRDVVSYLDLLAERPGLREHELAYLAVLRADSLLELNLLEFETRTATTHGENAQVSYLPVILVDYPEFAELLFEAERRAAADDAMLDAQLPAAAFLMASPDIADPIFANESGPTYEDADRKVGAYVEYLEGHPDLYRAWWRVYALIDQEPELNRRICEHWFWFRPRPPMRRAWWRYRLLAASDPVVHEVVWNRLLYLGTDAALAEEVWRHRLAMATRVEMRTIVRYLLDHPEVASDLLEHRRREAGR